MTVIAEGFVFGLASSLHCAAMCGPLGIAAGSNARQLGAYHGARALAYVAVGALLGGLGATSGAGFMKTHAHWVALALAIGLVANMLGLDRLLGALPGSGKVVRGAMTAARRWPAAARAATLGAVTPILPCGVLWALYGTALMSGTALSGAATTAGFAAGSAPLLGLAQLQAGSLRRWLGPERARWFARAMMLIAAGVLVWRSFAGASGRSCCG